MQNTSLSIGVFDSGMGGLTVLRALRDVLPQESFIYLGDTARLPYGTKSKQTVQHYAVQMAQILIKRRIKALVVACNTATTAALTVLQDMLPDIPVLGVVLPGASAAVAATKNQRIAVLATETTVASQAYQHEIKTHLPNSIIHVRACSLLVGLAEEGMIANQVAREALLHYLSGITVEDSVLLGCTHFPVFKPLIQKLLADGVNIIDTSHATAMSLYASLVANGLLYEQTSPRVEYLVTDSVERFQSVGEIFLGAPLSMDSIEWVEVEQKKIPSISY